MSASSTFPLLEWSGISAFLALPCSQWAAKTLAEKTNCAISFEPEGEFRDTRLCSKWPSAHQPISSSRRLHQYPDCWLRFSWCFPGVDSDVLKWPRCRVDPPSQESFQVLSPTTVAGSCTAWAEWFQWREASQYSGPPTLPSLQSPLAEGPAVGCQGITLEPHWEDPGLCTKRDERKLRNKALPSRNIRE